MDREIMLPVRRPFRLRATVLSYGYYQLPPFSWEGTRNILRRVERLADGDVYLLELREGKSHSRQEATVKMKIKGPRSSHRTVQRELALRARKMLRLDENLGPFYTLCRQHPDLKVIPRLGAGRLLRGTGLFEDLVKAISWTNTVWAAAVKMITRLCRIGDPCPSAPEMTAFPTPAQIADAGLPFLREKARLGYRAEYLTHLAQRVAGGELDLEKLDARSSMIDSQDLAKELLRIKGVGKATVAYIMAMLGHYDHLVIDSATYAYATKTFFQGRRPAEKQIERLFEKYGKWKALVAWFGYWLTREELSGQVMRKSAPGSEGV